ncbi:transposase [Dactylosporangium sp. NPDC049525]|uniref:transposase n=1 Tax=Dactylosporangium sp. NPDC049525 TaxID=3154730 RepID=UPI00343B89A8
MTAKTPPLFGVQLMRLADLRGLNVNSLARRAPVAETDVASVYGGAEANALLLRRLAPALDLHPATCSSSPNGRYSTTSPHWTRKRPAASANWHVNACPVRCRSHAISSNRWANLNAHVSAAMRQLTAARDWLHVIRLPAYAPDLNPTEAVWSHLKRSIGNLAVRGVGQLQAIIKHRPKSIRYQPDLIDGFLAHTGLTLEPDST